MNNNQIMQFASMMLQRNPKVANSPMGQQLVGILQSGDNAAGEQLANNILSQYGLSREEGIAQARRGFGI